ncbi:MAG: glycosyltransferase family 39 protein [Gaiellaceae bacterium]
MSGTQADARTSPSGFKWSLDRVRGNSLAIDVVLVGGVALALGLIGLGAPSLWVDEAFTAKAVRETLVNPLDQYHWFYYALLTPWTALAGDAEWALRMPSVFTSMVACGLLVIVGRRLFDRRVGLVSGLLLATSPFLVMWSQQARAYSLVLAASILSTLLLIVALERGTRRSWVLYGLAFSLVFALHPVSALFLVPAHAVAAARQRDKLLPHGLLAPCVIVVLGVPWAFARAKQTPVEHWLDRPSLEGAVTTLLDVSGMGGVGVVLAVVGVAVLWRAGLVDRASFLGVWAFAPFALALLASIARPIYLDRYLISAAPAFALLGAVALFGVRRRVALGLVTVIVATTTVGLVGWYRTAGDGNWRGEGWRDAVALVNERGAEADAVVVVPWWANPAATYYGASVSDTSTADRIWVLSWSETGHRLPAAERAPLGFGGHELSERVNFGERVSAQLWVRG